MKRPPLWGDPSFLKLVPLFGRYMLYLNDAIYNIDITPPRRYLIEKVFIDIFPLSHYLESIFTYIGAGNEFSCSYERFVIDLPESA